MKRLEQGRFIVEISEETARGRPVNYLNVNINSGAVVLDLGFVSPLMPGMEKQEATIVFRGGTTVGFLRVLNATLTAMLKQLDEQTPPDAAAPPAPPAAVGGQIN